MHSIGFLLRTTKPEWKSALKTPRYYVSLESQGGCSLNDSVPITKKGGCSLNDSVPITDPRRRSPWSVILIPSFLKIFCADCIRLLSFIRMIVFAGLGQFPMSGPMACRYSHHFFTPASDLTEKLSSAHHTCFTSSFAVSLLKACINGHVDRAYIAIAALSPYVTPSCDSMWFSFSR